MGHLVSFMTRLLVSFFGGGVICWSYPLHFSKEMEVSITMVLVYKCIINVTNFLYQLFTPKA
jgi:hypothetical protein